MNKVLGWGREGGGLKTDIVGILNERRVSNRIIVL